MTRNADRRRISAAVVVGTVALLVMLGATTYAALAGSSIVFTNAMLVHGWKRGGPDSAYPGYVKDPVGGVYLRGAVKGGPSASVAFALPKALASGHSAFFPVITGNETTSGLEVTGTGHVIPYGAPSGYVQPLDGMNFLSATSKVKFANPTLLNGWSYGGLNSAEPGYGKDSLGIVHLRGGLAGGVSGSEAFVLPAADAPSHAMWVPILTNGAGEGTVYITPSGQVIVYGTGANLYASLDGVIFAAGTSKLVFTNAKLIHLYKPGGYGSATPGYAEDSMGVVHLRGGLHGGRGSSFVAFALPKALRPSHTLSFPIYTQFGTEGLLIIFANGDVVPYGSNVKGYTSLDGISFVAGQ